MAKFVGIILTVVGAAIGGVIGGYPGAMMGGMIGGMVGGVIQAFALQPGVPHIPQMEPGQLETPKPNDFQIMSYAENAPIPYLCGTKLIAPQIIHIFDKWTVPVKQYQTYQVQEVDADGKDVDVETHDRVQEVIIAYDYYVRGLLGLVQGLQGHCRIGEVYVNGKLNTALQLVVKDGCRDPHSWMWDTYNYEHPQRHRDLFYVELDGSVGRNMFMMPSLQVSVTRLPSSDEFNFLSTPLPDNNDEPGCWLNIITTGLACFNNCEVWRLVDYYKDKWEPINSLTFNRWPFNKDFGPYDTNPESRTDYEASLNELEEFVGKDNIKGFCFHVPWYWDLADDVFRPFHAFETIRARIWVVEYGEYMGLKFPIKQEWQYKDIVKLKRKPRDSGRAQYITGIAREDGDDLVTYETRLPEGSTWYNPKVGGVTLFNEYWEPQIKQMYFDADHIPCYGGTPADDGLIEGIREVVNRGFEFSFYSFMEVADPPGEKPWRGALLPQHRTIGELLTDVKAQCLFYADLLIANNLKPKRFITCSELVKINQQKTYGQPHRSDVSTYTDDVGTFHFTSIPYLMDIVEEVRNKFQAVGWGDVLVGYSADWSEVNGFKDDQGYWWRPLDDLFDFQDEVFIDAYYGVTEHHTLDYQDYYRGWTSGRDWDYYVSDYDLWKQDQGGTAPITDRAFAAKDLTYWKENNHYNYNPDGTVNSQTVWVANSKKIYFTETGCPTVDSGATEPNLFFDPKAVQGGIPKGSTLTVCNTVQLFYYRSLVQNASEGKQPIREFGIWNVDTRPLFTLMGAGQKYWGDAYRIAVGHWMKYTAKDPISDIVINDFEQRRGMMLNVDLSAISSVFQQLKSDGWSWNVYIDNPTPFSELLKVFSKQYPVIFYVDDGKLTAKYLQPDNDGALYNVHDYPVYIYHDGAGYYIEEPFDHFIYQGKRYDIVDGYIDGWALPEGEYLIESSNVIENTLVVTDVQKTNIKASVTYFDTTNFENKGLKTRVASFEMVIDEGLNWQDVRLNQSLAPDELVAQMMARYVAASSVFNNNTFKAQTWQYYPTGSRIRVITNLKDSFYRIVNVKINDAGLIDYEGYEEPQPFHDILSEQIVPVDYPDKPALPEPRIDTAYFAENFDRWYAAVIYTPDIAWVMITATFADGNQTAFFVRQGASAMGLPLDDKTMPRLNGYKSGYCITDQGELLAYAPGIYGTYLLRGFDGTPIAASSNQLFTAALPNNEPVPEIGLGQSADIHAKVIYGEQTSSEVYLGNDIAYGIGGRVYKRKDKWVVTPLIRGLGAGTYGAGQAPQINYDILKMVIDGAEWLSTVEAELDSKPSDVVIYYGDYYCNVQVD